jgi:hypothetical protein
MKEILTLGDRIGNGEYQSLSPFQRAASTGRRIAVSEKTGQSNRDKYIVGG